MRNIAKPKFMFIINLNCMFGWPRQLTDTSTISVWLVNVRNRRYSLLYISSLATPSSDAISILCPVSVISFVFRIFIALIHETQMKWSCTFVKSLLFCWQTNRFIWKVFSVLLHPIKIRAINAPILYLLTLSNTILEFCAERTRRQYWSAFHIARQKLIFATRARSENVLMVSFTTHCSVRSKANTDYIRLSVFVARKGMNQCVLDTLSDVGFIFRNCLDGCSRVGLPFAFLLFWLF